MYNKRSNFLLYKLDPHLERLAEEEKRQKESNIQSLFSENLGTIFPDLIFLANELPLIHPKTEKLCRLDSLAFNKRDKNFLIVEYKAVKVNDLLDQVIEYQECLEEIEDREKNFAKLFKIVAKNRTKLVNLLNEKLEKKRWEEEDFSWNEIKGLCIIAETSLTLHYPGKRFDQYWETIRPMKITFYQEKILHIDTENIEQWLPTKNSQLTITKTTQPVKNFQSSPGTNSASISDIIKIEYISERVKDWLIKTDNLLSSSLEKLDREINIIK